MVDKQYLLNSRQVAEFVARGFLRFDELVPDDINQAVMDAFDKGGIKSHAAGTPLSECYPEPSPIGRMLRMPEIQGVIHSLVGPDPLFDHHAIHVRQPNEGKAQGMHGDSIIDTRMHFDIQIMYFPHDVPLEMAARCSSLAATSAASMKWTSPATRTLSARFRWSAKLAASSFCIMVSGTVAARTRQIANATCTKSA